MKRIILLLLLVLLTLPLSVFAELSEDVSADFSVLEGYVIMQINGEYLVDLDARNNLNIGDLLTVVKSGKKVLHPVTKEVVGTIDIPLGFLQVVRVHSGYSYAKPLDDELEVADGASVKRFEKVPARFVDKSADKGEIKRQVMINLPHFAWLDDTGSEDALLSFILENNSLDVKNASGDSLHRYSLTEDQQLVSTAASTQRPFVTSQAEPKPRLLQQVANSIVDVFEQSNDSRFAEMDEAIIRNKQIDRKGIWMSPNLAGHPIGLAVADLDGDKQQEIVTVLDGMLKISRVAEGQFTEVAELEIPSSLQVLSVDAVDLDSNGVAELYLSALLGYKPSSFVIEFNGEDFDFTIQRVRWFLRAVTLPGSDSATLVGQRIGNEERPFSGDMFYVKREGDTLVVGDVIKLPGQLNLFNFLPFKDERNQVNYVYLTRGDYLKVLSAAGDELYESDAYFGGSEESFNTRKEHKDEMLAPIYMRPRMVKMPGNEILVAQNEGQRMVQRFRKFNKSKVVSLGWNGFTLNEIWRTAAQSGYLAEFAVADADNDGQDEIVMAVKYKHSNMLDEARSAIVMYELE